MVLPLSSTTQEVKHGLAWRKWWSTRSCYGRISFTKANVHHVPLLNWPCICCYGVQRTEWECNLLYRNRPHIRAEKSIGNWPYAPCLRKRPPPTWQCLLSHCCQNLPFFCTFWGGAGFNSLTIHLKALTWPPVTFGYSQSRQKNLLGLSFIGKRILSGCWIQSWRVYLIVSTQTALLSAGHDSKSV